MIELREAQFSDYIAISKIHAESWRQNYRGILSDFFLEYEVEKDRLDVWFKRLKFPGNNQQVTIAIHNETIVGFYCLYLNDDPVFGSLLDNLHISTNLQKSGIGRLLMKDCAKYICDKSDHKRMYLWVFELNQKARNFYGRLGGTNFDTTEKQNNDGTSARVCRYTWEDVSVLI